MGIRHTLNASRLLIAKSAQQFVLVPESLSNIYTETRQSKSSQAPEKEINKTNLEMTFKGSEK
jgi:hypothetical protein